MSYLGTPYESFKYNNTVDTVDTITSQTIGGVKTFTNSPVIPDATASNEPLSKGQLLSAIEQLQENGFFPRQSTKAVGGLPADFTSSKATNGYQKLPSGLIIQWGIVPNSIGVDDPYTINYPIAFPNAALLGVAQMISTDFFLDNNSAAWSPVSNSQCSIIKDNNTDTAWIAIGY